MIELSLAVNGVFFPYLDKEEFLEQHAQLALEDLCKTRGL
jgi:hypothetical protein